MIKRYLIIILIIVAGTSLLRAQDPGFSQFYANQLYLNPAFAGANKCPRVGLNYRNQWPALGSTYVTYNVSYDQHVNFLEGGIGVLLMQDVQGDGAITTTSANIMYSYTIPINRNFSLTAAIEATYIQKKINWDFIFPDMLHPLYGAIYQSAETKVPYPTKNIWDFSTGIIGYNKNTFFGVTINHLTQPTESFKEASNAVLPRKYTVHFGTNIALSSRRFRRNQLWISPNIIYQQQAAFQQLNYGLYLNRNSIVGGIWLRQNFQFHYDSFIMLIGFIQDNLRFAYSYDLTISQLSNQTLGAHEISAAMTFSCKTRRKGKRAISCPSF